MSLADAVSMLSRGYFEARDRCFRRLRKTIATLRRSPAAY
jgi:hypothetical protein